MENSRWVVYDGNLIRATEPVVPVESRGLMYGDGCFETLRSYRGAYLKPDKHLARLKAAAIFLDIHFPSVLAHPFLKEMSADLIKKNELNDNDSVIRIQLWRSGGRGYGASGDEESHYSVLATPLPKIPHSISLATVDIKRIPNDSLPTQFKLTNNINYIIAAKQAGQKGADDALMQTVEGYVSETTIANLFWISGDTVFTPSIECDLLSGITRNILIQLIGEFNGIALKEGEFRLDDIYKADAVWICNSVREVVAVSQIDDVRYKISHPFLEKLKESFKDFLLNKLEN